MEGAFPLQPSHQPAGDYPLLEALHGKGSAALRVGVCQGEKIDHNDGFISVQLVMRS